MCYACCGICLHICHICNKCDHSKALKARNDEWVGARPDVGSTVLLWMRDIARPKGIATEKRFLYRRGESWIGLWPG